MQQLTKILVWSPVTPVLLSVRHFPPELELLADSPAFPPEAEHPGWGPGTLLATHGAPRKCASNETQEVRERCLGASEMNSQVREIFELQL